MQERDDLKTTAGAVRPRILSGRRRAEIRRYNGAPTLFIDGAPCSAFSYMTYGMKKAPFGDFWRAGVKLYSFAANADSLDLWGMAEVWKAPDQFDYSGEDKNFELILEAAPDALIFPRIHTVGPKWWTDSHPDELLCYTDDKGNRQPVVWENKRFPWPSWASEAGLRVGEEAVRRYIEHTRSAPYAPHLIGYQVCSWAVGEWMAVCIDSSRPMTERFRAFLEKKYRTVDALRKAWDNADVRFDTAEVPPQTAHFTPASQSFYEVPKDQRMIDYWENYEEVVTDALLRLTTVAKEACHNESVIGVFFGYLLQFGSHANIHGHTGLRKVLQSPTVDFASSPSCYNRRSLYNGYSYFMSLPETVKLHGKMWWDENDYRTYLVGPVTLKADEVAKWTDERRGAHYRNMRNWRIWGLTESLEESISHQQRETANCICHAAGMWWFDMEGGWFAEPQFMKAIARMYDVAERSVECDRSDAAQIAVVVDAQSLHYSPIPASVMQLLVIEQAPLLGRIGAPVSYYLLEDIEKAPDHRLWIFLNCFSPSPEMRKTISKKVKRNGQVAVWLYAPGLLDGGKLNAEQAAALTGIELRVLDKESPLAVTVTEAAHPLTMGLFETVYGATGTVGGRVRELRWRAEPVPTDEKKGWLRPYEDQLCRPTIYAADKKAMVLGYLTGVPEPGLVVKPQEAWTSVYSSAGPLSPQLVRNLARFAGVHLYVDTDDVVYANRSFLAISTNAGGQRTIRLPRACDVVETYSGTIVARNVSEFTTTIPAATTYLYYLGDADRWARASGSP